MDKWILGIINQGVSANNLDYTNRRIVYSNVIYLALPVVYLTFVIIDLRSYIKPLAELRWDQFIFVVEIGICAACIYLNKIHRHVLGKWMFIVTWPFLLHIIPIIHLDTPPDYYFAYPAGIIFHSVLIQLMFAYKTDKLSLYVLMTFNIVLTITCIDLLLFNDTDHDGTPTDIVNDLYYRLDIILYWLLFTLLSNFLMRSVDRLFDRLAEANKLIELQKEELTALNEGLEATIQERTRRIEEQNKKLKEHAFYNAHMLRGPFCRIKGLINLQTLSTSEQDQNDTNRYLHGAVSELDDVIGKIQQIVNDDSLEES